LPNETFFTLSFPTTYGIEIESRNLIMRTKLTTYLIFDR
jgi:hypothetical protein